jgi:hypothetical protein
MLVKQGNSRLFQFKFREMSICYELFALHSLAAEQPLQAEDSDFGAESALAALRYVSLR